MARVGAERTLPDVSVLMPVKDAGAELRKLIPSVLSQAYDGRVEVVAVDSGSVDDTVDVLLEHRATVLEIDPRTSITAGRATWPRGMRAATCSSS